MSTKLYNYMELYRVGVIPVVERLNTAVCQKGHP